MIPEEEIIRGFQENQEKIAEFCKKFNKENQKRMEEKLSFLRGEVKRIKLLHGELNLPKPKKPKYLQGEKQDGMGV